MKKKRLLALLLSFTLMLPTVSVAAAESVPAAIPTEQTVAEPIVDEPVIDESVTDEPVTDESVTDEPVTDESVIDESVTDEPVTDEPVIDEPVTDESVTDEPVIDESVTDEPVISEPITDESSSGDHSLELFTDAVASGDCGDDLTWTLDAEGTLTISGTGNMKHFASYSYVPWDDYFDSIKTVILPEGLTSISNYAFYGCSALTEINFPEGLTSIGQYAFQDCIALTAVTLPDGLSSIGDNAFYYCEALTTVRFPNGLSSIGQYAFAGCKALTEAALPDGLTSMGICAFQNCTALTTVTLPDSLTTIDTSTFQGCNALATINFPTGLTSMGNFAFKNCDTLTTVTLPDGLTSIGKSVFYDCDALTTVTLPDGLTSISESAFEDCDALNAINFNDRLTSIGNDAFAYCGALTTVTLPDGLTSIGNSAFYYCDALTTVNFPAGLTSIGNSAFCDCNALTTVTLPDGLTSIGTYAFASCDALTTVNFPDGLTSIGSYAFSNCEDLQRVDLPEGLISIGEYAFQRCYNLIKVTFPDSLETIGIRAFSECTSLKDFTLPENLQSIGNYAFMECTRLTKIHIPAAVTSIGQGALRSCTNLTELTVDADNTIYDSRNNCNALIETATGTLLTGISTTVVPAGVTAIADYAFYNQNSLKEIHLPEGVTSIGKEAFYDCDNLQTVTLPEGLQTIGTSAFYSCGINNTLCIPGSVSTIPKSAFFWCSSLNFVEIGNGVTSIEEDAFYNCYTLDAVVLPASVETIQLDAFGECDDLDKVIYVGTADQWDEILISSGNTYLENATREYVPAGTAEFIYASGSCGDNATWKLDTNGVLTISGSGAITDNPWNSYKSSILTVKIENGITSICEDAFCYSYSSSVFLPETLESIGNWAFSDCPLTDVYYYGTEETWAAITIGDYNDPLLNATLYYMTESEEPEEPQEPAELSLFFSPVNIPAGGSAGLKEISVMNSNGFTAGDTVTLTLNEGFSFSETQELIDGDTTLTYKWIDDTNLQVTAPEDPGDGFDLAGLTILADDTLEDGDEAILTVSADNCTSYSAVIATVVVSASEPELELYVEEPRQIEPGGTAVFDSMLVECEIPFTEGDEVTLTLEDGFTFAENMSIYDVGNPITIKEMNGNEMVILAPSDIDGSFGLDGLTIISNADVEIGSKVYMTVSMDGYTSCKESIGRVVSEISDEVWLNFKEIDLISGEATAFEDICIMKYFEFEAGQAVTLTLNEGFFFPADQTMMDGETEISYQLNSDTEMVIYAPAEPGNGFDLAGLTIEAEVGLEKEYEAILTITAEGCPVVEESVGMITEEAADILYLDVDPVEIAAGGEASFVTLGVDKGSMFTVGDKVTLTLSEGFSFAEEDTYYDHNRTPIERYSWSEQEIVVLAPEDPGHGFDLEDLTILADTGLADGTTCYMTASMDGYASVTEIAATVNGTAPEQPETSPGSGEATFKVVNALDVTEEEAELLKDGISGPELQMKITDIDATPGSPDEFEIKLNFESIEVLNNFATIQNSPLIQVLRDGTVIGTGDLLEAEAGDDSVELIIREDAYDFEEGDIITFTFDETFGLTKTAAGAEATVAVSGDLGDSDALTMVTVMEKSLEIEAAKSVTVTEKEIAALEKITVETYPGQFSATDELTFKLNNGFTFTTIPEGAVSEDDAAFTISGFTGDTITFEAGTISIEATTAAVDDEAVLTVSCNSYNSTSATVAVVTSSAVVTPPSYGNGKGEATFKLVDALEVTEEDAELLKDGISGPELQMKITDIDATPGSPDEFEIKLNLESIEVLNNLATIQNSPLIQVLRDGTVIGTGDLLEAEAGDGSVELIIREGSYDFEEDDIIVFTFDETFGLTKTAVGTEATVEVSGDFGDSDALTMITVVEKSLEIEAKKLAAVVEEEIVELYPITVAASIGTFSAEDVFTFKLSNGFEFIDVPDGAVLEDDDTFTISGFTEDEFDFKRGTIRIEATTAKVGNVAYLTVSCDGYPDAKTKVAKVITPEVNISVDEDEDVPVFYSGTNADNIGLTDDADHVSLKVNLSESFVGVWSNTEDFTLSLPEGVYVTDAEVSGEMKGMTEKETNNWFRAAYTKGEHKQFVFEKRTWEETETGDDTNDIDFTLTLVAEPSFVGDVTLTLEGEGIETQEVVIARFEAPYTVETTETDSTMAGSTTSVADIVVTEAAPGLWERNSEFLFDFGDADQKFVTGDYGVVSNSAVSDIIVAASTDAVGFSVTAESDNNAAVITLSNLQASIPAAAGTYDLYLQTTAAEAFLDAPLYSETENMTVSSVYTADAKTMVKEGYLNLIDIFFTTEYYLESASDDGLYVLDHFERITCPAGIPVSIPEKDYDHFAENTTKGVLTGTATADCSLVLSRYYDRVDYTITYQTNGGTELPALTAKYGTPITLAEPVRYAYAFDGWYLDETLSIPCDYTTMPANGGTVYAKWTSVTDSRSTEYLIESIQLTDGNGNYTATSIPQDVFFAEVNVKNLSSRFRDTTILAAYADNQLVSLQYMTATIQIGDTVTFGATVDNTAGNITMLKAFVVPLLNGVPLAQSVTFTSEP